MARKPTLSPSKLTTFLACPVKYRWTYVDDRGKWYLRSKSYYSFGSTLHRVLERFHNSDDAGVRTTDEVLAAYDESWIDAGFSSGEEMAEAYGEGKAILERHVEEVKKRETDAKVLFVEKLFTLDMDEFKLVGRIDRVDEHADGTLEIVDYKSGREEVDEEEVATDIAMSVYQLLLRRKYPERKVVATIFALRSGAQATASLSDVEINQFEIDVKALGLTILNEEFYDLTPVFKPLCIRCDFIPLCRKHEDYAEL